MTARSQMPTNGRKRKRRQNLLAEDPHCYWCGREVREYSEEDLNGKPYPPDLATLDHLNSRAEYPDGRPYTWHFPSTVLACRPCNCRRGEDCAAGRGDRWVPFTERVSLVADGREC